jgi:hypothetical protein
MLTKDYLIQIKSECKVLSHYQHTPLVILSNKCRVYQHYCHLHINSAQFNKRQHTIVMSTLFLFDH